MDMTDRCPDSNMKHDKSLLHRLNPFVEELTVSLSPFREEDGQWKEDQKLEAHSDWVRDVGWAPSIGLPTSTIASCSQVRFIGSKRKDARPAQHFSSPQQHRKFL